MTSESIDQHTKDLLRHSIPVRVEGVDACKVVDEWILYAPGRDQGFTLNASGATVWNAITGTRTAEAITLQIFETLESPAPELKPILLNDVLDVLQQMDTFGLIEWKSA